MSRGFGVVLVGLSLVVGVVILSCGDDDDPASAGIVIAVEPDSVEVQVRSTFQFTVIVTGTEDSVVTWTVREGPLHGSVDATGLYTAPETLPSPPTATIRAVRVADPAQFGEATITIADVEPDTPELVLIPHGSFTMGDGEAACGEEEHPVSLTEDFYLGQSEVTNQEYMEMVQWAYNRGKVTVTAASVMDAMGSAQELLDLNGRECEIQFVDGTFSLRDVGHGINPDHPVKKVSWFGAVAYCNWLSLKDGLPAAYNHLDWQCNEGDPYRARGYRLPTDAEWEFAAQYNDERIYPWGNEAPTCDRANYHGCNEFWTEPVKSQVAGAEKSIGGKGLFGMAGNVWEWCNDWHKCAPDTTPTDPPGPAIGTRRVVRGGSWRGGDLVHLRSASRPINFIDPVSTYDDLGFRVARTRFP